MKFKALPVTSLEDATVDFEQLSTRSILDSTAQSFLQLLTAGTVQVARGTVTFTFTASAVSASQTVTHGIARSPTVFLQNASGGNFLSSTLTAVGASTFTANAFQTEGTVLTTSTQFYWVAIG